MTLPLWRLAAFGLLGAAGAMLAGCDDSYLDNGPGRSEQPISSATLAEMTKIDTTPSSPVVIRTYKKEAELEIWKMKSDGHYALLKTYPMCRWSGQLGPKTREGDMQVPEGFYTIAPGQMNPNSHYYLSFNVGYPNAYDRALGRTGGSVMVHGVCSSAGCFSMTDEQVADIYAIARDAFRGGQREIQLQSYPFHMTAENLAKYRLDPNIAFWKELKNGSDHFEVTKEEPPVVVCGKHYVFGATTNGSVSAGAPCPALHRDEDVEAAVAEKVDQDNAKVAELVDSGVKPIRTVYADGGQNPVFRRIQGRKRPRRAGFGSAGYRAGGAGFPRRQDRRGASRRQTGARQHLGADQRHGAARRSGRASCRCGGCDRRRRRRPSGQGRQKGREGGANYGGGRRVGSCRPGFRVAAAEPDGRARVDRPAGQFGRSLGRQHADNEEVAASWRPGPGPAGRHGLCPGPACSVKRPPAAAP